MRIFILLISLAVIINSCSSYSEEDLKSFEKQIKEYVNQHNIEVQRSSSGLYYRIDTVGHGENILYTNYIDVTYKGTLLDGTVFDEHIEPVEFQVRGVIASWQEILLQMKEGGKAFIISPPQLGYGARELDDIPANSVLVYELEVVHVH